MNIRKAGLSEGRPQGGRSDDRGLMRLSWTQAERGFDDSEPPFLWSLAMRHGQSCGYWAQNSASRFPKTGEWRRSSLRIGGELGLGQAASWLLAG